MRAAHRRVEATSSSPLATTITDHPTIPLCELLPNSPPILGRVTQPVPGVIWEHASQDFEDSPHAPGSDGGVARAARRVRFELLL